MNGKQLSMKNTESSKASNLKNFKQKYWSVAIFSIGFVFLLIGLFQSEQQIVLSKAIRICLECIGIG